jgi:hypothetical protein
MPVIPGLRNQRGNSKSQEPSSKQSRNPKGINLNRLTLSGMVYPTATGRDFDYEKDYDYDHEYSAAPHHVSRSIQRKPSAAPLNVNLRGASGRRHATL